MISRAIRLKPNEQITPCPKCGNNTEFTARSRQFAEDCCEVWVTCRCGFDPTADNTDCRVEDVWGLLDPGNVMAALRHSWNDLFTPTAARKEDGRG